MTMLNGIDKKIKKIGLGALLVGVMSISLVACGEGSTGSTVADPTATVGSAAPTSEGTGSGSMTESAVTLSEWAVTLNSAEVPAGKVKFNVANSGQFSHNYVIMEGTNEVGRTPNFVSADGTKVLEVDLKPGTYKVLCDIIGHPEKGMVNTLTVK